MATATQAARNGTQAQTATKPASNASDEAAKKGAEIVAQMLEKTEVTFTPFQSKDPIKLNVNMVLKHLCTPTKSGKVCTESQAIKFIMLCKARGLNPWEGDAYIVGYDSKDGPSFSLITAHQAFLKRAEVHPEYDGMESGVTLCGPDGTISDHQGDYAPPRHVLVAGWARIHFKSRSVPTYRRLGLAQFNKGYGVWKNNPHGMIVKCAEADALRSSFPTELGGMYLSDERFGSDEMATLAAADVPPTGVAGLSAKLASRKTTPSLTASPSVQVPTDAIPDAPAVLPPDDETQGGESPPVEPVKPATSKPAKVYDPQVDGDPDPNSPEEKAALEKWNRDVAGADAQRQ